MPSQPKRARTGLLITLIAAVAVAAIIVWVVVANLRSTDAAASEVPQSALPDSTSMGVVELQVADLDQMRGYYETALGLRVLNESADTVELGLDQPLITLQVGEGTAPASTPSEAGLYHSAILYPDEAALARVLLRIATVAPNSFQGSADHKVSLAFYFVDPEGNGLELYTDRPSDEWNWVNGEVEMGAYALDPNQFITEHLGSDLSTELGLKLDPDATADMGHVHMKVGDLATAEQFYADTLGFAVTARSDGALFYAAGGYHHHLATNVWQSVGAGERENPIGLGSLTVHVGDATELSAVSERLDAAGIEHAITGETLTVNDPWGNLVRVTAGAN